MFSGALSAASIGPQGVERNRGQFPRGVLYASDAGGAFTALTTEGLEFRHAGRKIVARFDGASFSQCQPGSTQQGTKNYLNLTPPISGVPVYDSVVCHEIYPGIDWVLRSTERGLEQLTGRGSRTAHRHWSSSGYRRHNYDHFTYLGTQSSPFDSTDCFRVVINTENGNESTALINRGG